MLSDFEQRALEELERRYNADAPERIASRRSSRPPGLRALVVLGCVSVVLLILGAALAALALATAGTIGWLSWGLWTNRAYGATAAASMLLGAGHDGRGSARRPGQSVRRYLGWLSEAE